MMKRAASPGAAQTINARGAVLARKCDCGNHAAGGTCAACATKRQRHVSRYTAPTPHDSTQAPTPNGVPTIVHQTIATSGQQLPTAVRAFMEPRFGTDFSDVRLHTDDAAARSSAAVSARAYTVGSHVVFGAGEYAPATLAGQRLIAHELTHVVQQQASTPTHTRPESIGHPADASEREADRIADRVISKASPPPLDRALIPSAAAGISGSAAPSGVVRRQVLDAISGIEVGLGVVGAFGAGVLIGTLAGAFDRDIYSTEELVEYLDGLARRHRTEGHRNSDNKARDVVRRWRINDPRINVNAGYRSAQGHALTSVELKRLLIAEMLEGRASGADEEAILEILDRSTAHDVIEILDPPFGVSVNQLHDKIGGDNNARLQAILETKFPRESDVRRQETRRSGCNGAESVMLFQAVRAATERVDYAIVALERPDNPDVRPALDCRFRGANQAQIAHIKGVFRRILDELPARQFRCLREGEAIPIPGNEPLSCSDQEATSVIGGDAPITYLCKKFLTSDPEKQAVTIIHETAHYAGVDADIQTQPPCGWDLGQALQEPDSYALLASELFAVRGIRPQPGR